MSEATTDRDRSLNREPGYHDLVYREKDDRLGLLAGPPMPKLQGRICAVFAVASGVP